MPKGRLIWIFGGIPKDVFDELYQQKMMGPSEHFGKVSIKGKFKYGVKYGHLGSYDYQIVPLEIELLLWAQPARQ